MPAPTGRGRPHKWSRRQLIDGICWRTRVGAPWRDVPERYGHWQSIYALFRRWQREKVWALVWSTLLAWADTGGLIRWDVSVDSTINRAHQHAAGARRHPGEQVEPPGDEPPDHALGRSRGGWTTKIHLACEQGRRPLATLLTAGQRGDSPSSSRCSRRSACPAAGVGGRAPARTGSWPTRPTPRGPIAPTCAAARSPPRSRSRPTSRPTGRPAAPPGAVHRPSTRDLPAAPRRGVRHQPAQTTPGDRHPLRL
ncbi:IS5 family transposase [Pseudonocardia sp. RS010]|uniref:IS5 family transposase n=1 Tax=Pseudonocardia sp. RS010 TaxID=3385979 RepID=UPI0039A084AE